jgi:hypothetical protein
MPNAALQTLLKKANTPFEVFKKAGEDFEITSDEIKILTAWFAEVIPTWILMSMAEREASVAQLWEQIEASITKRKIKQIFLGIGVVIGSGFVGALLYKGME